MMSKSSLGISVFLLGVALLLVAKSSAASQLESTKDPEDRSQSTAYITMPSNFARFLFYHARPATESRQTAGSNLLGYKRSSSALDALTGVTLGKRSGAAPSTVELLNMDPLLLGRQYGIRSSPRYYDLRWDSYDMPADN